MLLQNSINLHFEYSLFMKAGTVNLSVETVYFLHVHQPLLVKTKGRTLLYVHLAPPCGLYSQLHVLFNSVDFFFFFLKIKAP